jgi:transglutaminase-like putative cysteine protease
VRAGLVLAATVGVYLQQGSLLGSTGGPAFLAVLATLKLLEVRDRRDVIVTVYIGYFLVLTQFLASQSPITGAYALAAVLIFTTLLVQAHHPQASGLRPGHLRVAAMLAVQGLPLMLVLFVFFPRIASPLWTLALHPTVARTGLSQDMAPGSIASLILSDAVAFRVDFLNRLPRQAELYWRGPVLWRFDGRRWTAGTPRGGPVPDFTPDGAPVHYAVTLEPHNQKWLFALDLPATVPDDAGLGLDFQLLAGATVVEAMRYEVTSFPGYRAAGLALSDDQRRRALALPNGFGAQARALAQGWREALAAREDDRALVRRALDHFREQPFVYTVTPPLLGADPIDEFLFETRAGFCEHFASAFTFLMRAVGVPARVVTGYQGGEINPLGDYMIVRQSDAHAWAEVWLAGAGWVRIDPTSAVAPGRITRSLGEAVGADAALPLMARSARLGWLRAIRLALDAVDKGWTQWVIGYDTQRQLDLLRRLGLDGVGRDVLALAVGMGLIGLMSVLAALLIHPRRRRSRDPVVRTYARFCRKLARRGLARRPDEGPIAFAERVAHECPPLAAQTRAIATLFALERYGREHRPERVKRLRLLVGRFPR